MSSVSVVQYQSSPQKLNNVLQQNNSQNLQVNRDVFIVRKPSIPSSAGSTLNPKDILLTNPARKKSKPGEKVSNPAPISVARRNARERNRVKQVNNGFATLRQHIPSTIAAAFESSNGRGGSKKLSKVETLRMAVEYIRTLEDMLDTDPTEGSFSEVSNSENISSLSLSTGNSYNSLSSASTPSSSPITTAIIPNQTTSNINIYSYPIMSPSMNEEDDLHRASVINTPPHSLPSLGHLNYSTTTKTYQIPLSDFYDNEHMEPLDENMLHQELIDGDLDLLNSMHTTGSLSPEMYSDDSLSPIAIDRCRSNQQMFIPVFNSTNEDIKLRITPEMIMEIKTEPMEEDSKENMTGVLQWWDVHQQNRS